MWLPFVYVKFARLCSPSLVARFGYIKYIHVLEIDSHLKLFTDSRDPRTKELETRIISKCVMLTSHSVWKRPISERVKFNFYRFYSNVANFIWNTIEWIIIVALNCLEPGNCGRTHKKRTTTTTIDHLILSNRAFSISFAFSDYCSKSFPLELITSHKVLHRSIPMNIFIPNNCSFFFKWCLVYVVCSNLIVADKAKINRFIVCVAIFENISLFGIWYSAI